LAARLVRHRELPRGASRIAVGRKSYKMAQSGDRDEAVAMIYRFVDAPFPRLWPIVIVIVIFRPGGNPRARRIRCWITICFEIFGRSRRVQHLIDEASRAELKQSGGRKPKLPGNAESIHQKILFPGGGCSFR